MDVPYFRQDTSYTCGPTSLQMVFDFFGTHLSEKKLTQKLHPSKKAGTHHRELIRVARRGGFYCYVHERSSLHEIARFIAEDVPPIVRYKETEGDGHFAVVTGMGSAFVLMNDPWHGRDFSLGADEFLERWNVDGYERWLMAISPDPFSIGKSYGPLGLRTAVR